MSLKRLSIFGLPVGGGVQQSSEIPKKELNDDAQDLHETGKTKMLYSLEFKGLPLCATLPQMKPHQYSKSLR